jgi:hypothetical protein
VPRNTHAPPTRRGFRLTAGQVAQSIMLPMTPPYQTRIRRIRLRQLALLSLQVSHQHPLRHRRSRSWWDQYFDRGAPAIRGWRDQKHCPKSSHDFLTPADYSTNSRQRVPNEHVYHVGAIEASVHEDHPRRLLAYLADDPGFLATFCHVRGCREDSHRRRYETFRSSLSAIQTLMMD